MGKHEVRGVKKEKIYTLRKKLDEFIEEDKKRRDRNVYILERFEKMRSTVAILKNLNNHKEMEHESNIYPLLIRNNDRMVTRRDMMNYNRENHVNDNNIILKELSKKYILIPRTYSNNRYPVMDIKQSDDVDWRSKYDILNELKKQEREEPPEKDMNVNFVQEDSMLRNTSNFRSRNNNNKIKSWPNDKEKANISSEPTSSLLSDNCTPESKIDEISNVQNNNVQDRKNLENNLNINISPEREYIKDEKDNISTKGFKTNYSDKQDKSTKILKENEIHKIDHDAKPQVLDEVKKENVIKQNKENYIGEHCEDINNEMQELQSKDLLHPIINERNLNEYETKQEPLHSENLNENVIRKMHHDEVPEIYANDNNYASDQYNYYEESHTHEEQHRNYGNVNQEAEDNRNQNCAQEYENSQNNYEYGSQNLENYEVSNNYPTENQNIVYQNDDQQTSEYIRSDDHISSEVTQEINVNNDQLVNQETVMNISDNPQSYVEPENGLEFNQQQQIYNDPNINFNTNDPRYIEHEKGIEFDQQQQIYDQQNYVEQSHLEIHPPYININEGILENNVTDNSQESATNHDMYHEYNIQNNIQIEQSFEESHNLNVQNENNNLQQQAYNNENFNDIYQDDPDSKKHAAQNQEIQQQDGLGLSEQSHEIIHYDERNGLIAQNEIDNFQEDYSNQNIHDIYQEGNSEAQEILDCNLHRDNTVQNNENDNYFDGTRKSQENM